MIERLNCNDWDEVRKYHPDSSNPKMLERFLFLFEKCVSVFSPYPILSKIKIL